MAPASVKEVVDFFGMKLSEFKNEWALMSEKEKAEIREGIGNGSFTY